MMKKTETGQGIVEFALVIPIILVLIVGIFEAGRAIWIYSAVTNASREAARYGSAAGDNGSGTPRYIDCAGIRAIARQQGAPGNVQNADITISYDSGPGTSSKGSCPVSAGSIVLGDRIIVQVVGHFTPAAYVPIFRFPSFNITSLLRKTIIKEVNLIIP